MLQLLKLCIILLALAVQGSSASPIHHENKWRSATSSPSEADAHVEPPASVSLPASPPSGRHGPTQLKDSWRSTAPSSSTVAAAPVPEVVEGLQPSPSPGAPNLHPPFKASPPQPISEPPASPSSPTISPPLKASPPQTSVLEPPASPSSPTLSPPSKASPPPPAFLQPPSSPSSRTLLPPSKASPPLPTLVVPPASPSSSTSPFPSMAYPPQPTFHEPPASPRPPTLPSPSKASPPQSTFLEPPASPRHPTSSPPFTASTPQPTFHEPPASPTLSPPFTASPTQPKFPNPPTSPTSPTLSPPFKAYPPHPLFHRHLPSGKMPAPENEPHKRSSTLVPVASAPTATPSKASQKNASASRPGMKSSLPPISHKSNTPNKKASIPEPISPVSVASPPQNLGNNQHAEHPLVPITSPSVLHAPSKSPKTLHPPNSPASHAARQRVSPNKSPDPFVAPPTNTPSNFDWRRDKVPVASPPSKAPELLTPRVHSPAQGEAPSVHQDWKHVHGAPLPSTVSANPSSGERYHTPAPLPSGSSHKDHHLRNQVVSPAPTSDLGSPSTREPQVMPPSLIPTSGRTYGPPPYKPVSPKMPKLPHFQSLPPPPPNEDCLSTVCVDPYTNTPPGSPCGCVLPMQVGLQLSVALYTFFPLVSELAAEIASGVFMKQSQVRIMGANAASQQPEKTAVLIDLVPLGEKFDSTTAFLTSQRFWRKQVMIQASYFGDYDVLYVTYPGLPPSPPLPPSITMNDGGPYAGSDNNARTIKPLGVDVPKRRHKDDFSGGVIAVIALSAFVAVVLCSAAAWIFLFKGKDHVDQQPASTPRVSVPSLAKPSGNGGSLIGSGPSSTSPSFGSSIAAYKGTARTFSMNDMERATDNFNTSRVLGEGGFGRVYSGVLDDGINVAVKVLKRDDQQGGREFLAEVEMLSRLHHRNLVKLIGICTEDRIRCLVYELIPNGSVESHLHGVDKDTAPLDWSARMKVALGSARGLAYLHEDSSPRVIHRDFKSSNILLEHDFTPKVSDFGLARTAMDEENTHISTRVMGTFGYVAPEYAMTGHLLVKSDVYSYGVVLLELLTGRKPVDMSQPPGQENLVAWARPLLTSKEGLEMIVDPSLGSDVPFDSIAKVAAIASMCVQPEVSNRPFMGEVVQALKLVCNECDEANEAVTRSSSLDDLSIDLDAGGRYASSQLPDNLGRQFSVTNFPSTHDVEGGYSASELFSSSARFPRPPSASFRRLSSSGSLRTGRNRQFWRIIKRFSGGSVSEHGMIYNIWSGSH